MFERSIHSAHRRMHHRDARRDAHHLGGDNHPDWLHGLTGRGRGQVRRGEIRPLILAALTRRPMHGYEVIQELELQSRGRWRPSAGSVYPTLQQLSDEGLVTGTEIDGRRTYTLTDAGHAAASAAPPARGRWSDAERDSEPDLRRLGLQVVGAVMQVQRVGSPSARREANRILVDARRQIYRLLADDEAPTAAETGAPDTATRTDEPGPG
jgi:DNA-binding PadR family transcriptional regulator